MNNPSIDNLQEQIQDPRTKSYFDEVLSCYYSGNYRSAVVMLYATAICDLIYKLNDLVATYNDTGAQQILTDVTNMQTSNLTSPAWELALPNLCWKNNKIIDGVDYSNFEALQKLRNLCAHPVLTGNQELYQPNKESVLGHIMNMLTGFLTKPAFIKKDMFMMMLNDISVNKPYLIQEKDLENYLNVKYLNKVNNIEAEYFFFKSLWKFVFQLDDQPCKENREINYRTLIYLFSRHSDSFLDLFDKEKEYFGKHIFIGKSNRIKLLIQTFNIYPKLFEKLGNDIKITVNNYIDTDQSLKAMSLYRSDDCYKYAITELAPTSEIGLYVSQFLRENRGPAFSLDYNIRLFANSDCFDTADRRFDWFIQPHIDEFTETQLVQIVDCIQHNGQIFARRRAKQDNTEIYNKLIAFNAGFDFTSYGNFDHF